MIWIDNMSPEEKTRFGRLMELLFKINVEKLAKMIDNKLDGKRSN